MTNTEVSHFTVRALSSEPFQELFTLSDEELEKAGIKVITASNKLGIAKASDNKSRTKVDLTIDQIDPKDYAGIFLIGGPGALENLDNPKTYKLLKEIKELNIDIK